MPDASLHLPALVRQLLQDAREAARERGDAPFSFPLDALQRAEATLRTEARPRVEDVEATYRDRTQALDAAVQTRRVRLEAYAQRIRNRVPPKEDAAVLAGRVTDAASGGALPHLAVQARDAEGRVVASTHTDALGYFRVERASEGAASEVAASEGAGSKDPGSEGGEALTLEVLDAEGAPIFTHASAKPARPGAAAFVSAAVDGDRVPASRALGQEIAQAVARQERVLRQRSEALRPITPAGSDREEPPPVVPAKATPPPLLRPLLERRRPAVPPVFQQAGPDLRTVPGIGEVYGQRLHDQGYDTAASVAALAPEDLAALLDVSPTRAATIVEAARRTLTRE